jgi:hypothetical protein
LNQGIYFQLRHGRDRTSSLLRHMTSASNTVGVID